MKQLTVLIFSFCLLISATSCKKGDTGPAGSQGPAGVAGNANVTQYNFAGNDFSVTSSIVLHLKTTADTANRSAWHVYFVRPNGLVYAIPGFGLGAISDYRAYWSFSSQLNFFINKVAGPGEDYASIRIIRIYANTVIAGRTQESLPAIDFSDYHAVCEYYKLPH